MIIENIDRFSLELNDLISDNVISGLAEGKKYEGVCLKKHGLFFGLATFCFDVSKAAVLNHVFVKKQYRNLGYGSDLIKMVMERLKKMKYSGDLVCRLKGQINEIDWIESFLFTNGFSIRQEEHISDSVLYHEWFICISEVK